MNQTGRFNGGQFLLASVLFIPIVIAIGQDVFYSRLTKIAEVKNYSTNEKRDIINTFDLEAQSDQGFPLDPFDLMNRLKQAGAINNATTPSDALDEALNAFDASAY